MSPADPRATLQEATESLREAGRLVRAVQNRMRGDGLREDLDYRDLDVRITNALAAVEGGYTEAKRHHDRLQRGSG